MARRRRWRTVDGQIWNLNDSFYRLETVLNTRILDPTDIPEGAIAYLQSLGIDQDRFVDRLTTRMPTPEEAQRLQVGPGIPVVVQARTAYSNDEPVRYTVSVYPGDRHVLTYEIPA